MTCKKLLNFAWKALLPATTATLWLSACGVPSSEESYDRLHSDSGHRGLPYTKLVERIDQLQKNAQDQVQVVRYGKSVENRDLILIRLANDQAALRAKSGETRPAVLITQAIHGDEYQELADRLAATYAESPQSHEKYQKFIDNGGILYIVPVVNPDGYDRRQRGNRQGIDLNRDWHSDYEKVEGFRSPETKALSQYLQQELAVSGATLKMSLDYHCCSLGKSGGLLIHPWGTSQDLGDGSIPEADVKRFEYLGSYFQNYFPKASYGTPAQTVNYTAKGSLMDYMYEQDHALALSYEGLYNREHQLFETHARFWDGLLEKVETL